MSVRVILGKPFSDAVGAKEVFVGIEGRTVRDVIDRIVADHPPLGRLLFDEDGGLTDYVVIFLNGRPVPETDAQGPVPKDGDELTLLMPVSGG